ncbi:serine hydrolase [Deinococcus radiophilus]|uniref:serine hydrolase n=1 Tax=Deinococcus radiophilus TaxID=32062 RepID=UPI003606A3A9
MKVTGRGWTAQFERGEVPVSGFQVDREGRVILLQFQPTVTFTDLDEARAAFAALPGEVSLLVRPLDGGNQGVSLNAGQYLAVGSTFKLAILGELQARIARGEMRWEDELTLTDAERSLPSGTLQEAPAGRRYTLRDLADRMIRDSDNTATDLLMAHVGAEAVSRRLGQVAAPNTRQAFTLKARRIWICSGPTARQGWTLRPAAPCSPRLRRGHFPVWLPL